MLQTGDSSSSSSSSSSDDDDDDYFPLEDIPDGPLSHVASFLSIQDALSFSHTCKTFYSLNVWVEVGAVADIIIPFNERVRPGAALLTVLRARATARSSSSENFNIAWGEDDRYWHRAPIEGSFDLLARCLRTVWWFDVNDVSGKLVARGRGDHYVFVRVKALGQTYGLGDLERRVWAVAPPPPPSVPASSSTLNSSRGAARGGGGGGGGPPRFSSPAIVTTHDTWPLLITRNRIPRDKWDWLPVGYVTLSCAPNESLAPIAHIAFSMLDHHGSMKERVAFSHAVIVHSDDLTNSQKAALRWGGGGGASSAVAGGAVGGAVDGAGGGGRD